MTNQNPPSGVPQPPFGQQPPPGYGQQPPVPFGEQPTVPLGQQQFMPPGHQPAGNQPFGQQPPAPYGQQQPPAPYGQQPTAPYGQPAQQPTAPYGQQPTVPFGQASVPPNGQPPTPYGYAQPPTEEPKKSKKKLWLGIGIPVVVLALLGTAAAIVVPGMIRDQNASAAAKEFMDDHDKWAKTFNEDDLKPYAELSSMNIMSSWSGDDSTLAEAECALLPDLTSGLDKLKTAPPKLKTVEGGDSNKEYAKAQDVAAEYKDAYAASKTFSTDAATNIDALAATCSYLLDTYATSDIYQPRVDAELTPLETLSKDQQETYVTGSTTLTFTCGDKCVTFLNLDTRKKYGTSYADIYGQWYDDLAESAKVCPTDAMAAICEANSAWYAGDGEAYRAVGNAYLTDDPIAIGLALGTPQFDPSPSLTAAWDLYDSNRAASEEAMNAALADFGKPTMREAYQSTVDDAAAALKDLVGKITTTK